MQIILKTWNTKFAKPALLTMAKQIATKELFLSNVLDFMPPFP